MDRLVNQNSKKMLLK